MTDHPNEPEPVDGPAEEPAAAPTIEPTDEQTDGPNEPSETDDESTDWDEEPGRRPWLGVTALLLGLTVVGFDIAAYVAALDDVHAVASALVFVALGASVVAVVLGILAIVLRAGRWWGVAGLVLGVVANPLLMVWTLRALSGPTT